MPLSQLLDNNETDTPIYLETPQDQSNAVEQPPLTNKTNAHSIIDGNRQETAPRPMQMAEPHTGDQNSKPMATPKETTTSSEAQSNDTLAQDNNLSIAI